MAWYADYSARTASDVAEGRLVSLYQFTEAWDSCGTHPAGAEIVLCIAGAMTLHQELVDGTTITVTPAVGDYVINPPGAWHTADVDGQATALFITAGMGTQHRPQ